MPDLADGESVEIQGSAAKPYLLKNMGGVYSCSCLAWRNQSLAIDRRTCKHLRQYRGESAEQVRLEGTLVSPAKAPVVSKSTPPLLLAHTWDTEQDLTGGAAARREADRPKTEEGVHRASGRLIALRFRRSLLIVTSRSNPSPIT
jgi:hypothetical protein